jgi:hypothetical protein
MKSLYIIDYWVPFPSSEYGGLINVIAEDDNECHDILLNWRDDCESSHDSQIMDKVKKASRFSLQDDVESGIIDSFTT